MPRILRIINRFNLGGPTYNAAYLTKYLPPEFETLLVGGEKDESEDSSGFILDNLGIVPEIIPEMRREIDLKNDYEAYRKVAQLIRDFKPEMVLVHGDTTTTFSAALAAYYQGVRVGHVEAGLRSFDKFSPFPEEMNRCLTGRLADLHFSPTDQNVQNLINEGVDPAAILKTGNTVIDALLSVIRPDYEFDVPELRGIDYDHRNVILLTAHRRENLGAPMESIFSAVRKIVDEYPQVELIFPMHKNPAVREIAARHFEGCERIHRIEPLDYEPFAHLMAKSWLILTDSGGIQEEAPALGKPVLVLRRETERPEAVMAGTVKLAGIEAREIHSLCEALLTQPEVYQAMANAVNPYGDGKASMRIVERIKAALRPELNEV